MYNGSICQVILFSAVPVGHYGKPTGFALYKLVWNSDKDQFYAMGFTIILILFWNA